MIKQNQGKLNTIHIINDIICNLLSIAISYFLSLYIFHYDILNGYDDYIYISVTVISIVLIQIICNKIFDLYRSYRSTRFILEIINITRSGIVTFVILIFISIVTSTLFNFQVAIALYFFVNTFMLVLYRFILRKILRLMRSRGYNKKFIVFLGINNGADSIVNKINSSPDLGYEIWGYFDIAPHSQCGLHYLGNFKKVSRYFSENHPDEAIIALTDKSQPYMGHLVAICENWGVKFSIIPDIFSSFSSRIFISSFDGIPVLGMRKVPLDNKFNAFIKRLFDIIVSFIMLIIFSPFMCITALIIKLTSPGHVIFKQKRVGLGRKPFIMYKFRSMREETENDISMAEENDLRCTKFGHFIRKYSIDEFPQLINVLKGDMSLVGPRPEIPFYVEQYRKSVPLYMVKHYVKPGMTGWAQIHDLRGGDTSIAERIKYDIYYIEHWSLTLDIKILFKTLYKCLSSKNAR